MKNIYILSLLIAIASCSSAEKKEVKEKTPARAVPRLETRTIEKDVESSHFAEISFSKGSDELSSAAKGKIDALVAKALQKGEIEEIRVVTWADQEYPSKEKESLSQNQRDLADARGDVIEDYLEEKHDMIIGVEKISMAKRANYLKRLFKTEDARVKRALVDSGIPTTEEEKPANAKASKAILIVLLKD